MGQIELACNSFWSLEKNILSDMGIAGTFRIAITAIDHYRRFMIVWGDSFMERFAGLLPVMVIWWPNEDFWWGSAALGLFYGECRSAVRRQEKHNHCS